ncbi:hypothetical protein ACEE90_10455 [Corynebacterium phoceense]|uniref:hypothetical protein n=1 Tax=Corynebacterium TaxID=1716 RepID=UPI001E0DF1A5|nr:hypothetical protein [Corynebacterium phoceense]MCQ9334652.1 hypothetical protein [Corynebacterium phoceense]MCQ9337552.1 hypothetical protein [Corynebacterium phoceense]HJG44282.1 hypothetical protein [Corynebacterium phoceense]
MARAAIEFILGAVILAAAIWWFSVEGPSFLSLAPMVLMGVGGALMVAGFSDALDTHSPTKRKI